MTAEKTIVTADELYRMPDDGYRYELVRGELRKMAPTGGVHGLIASRILIRVGTYVEANRLGETFIAEAGFFLYRNPDTVRCPDVSFVAADRLPASGVPVTFLELTPDLAVEVVSPSDTAREVHEKVLEWLDAGTRMVWVFYPSTRTVRVHRLRQDVKILGEQDMLEGADVLPGFICSVRELFPTTK